MLSYQHSYHAGNRADLHKHALLAELLVLLTRKPRPITVMETHSGRGLYDLHSEDALKTGEAADGIARAGDLSDLALATALEAHPKDTYPGSPAITAALLRTGDRHILMEKHPGEHRHLKANMPQAEVHHRDGYEGVLALSPPKPRRGLVLIDPSYEVKSEYEQVPAVTHQLIARWPQAVVAIWYPLLPAARDEALKAALKLPKLISEVTFPDTPKAMFGSGMAIINAPYGFEERIPATLNALSNLMRPR